MRAVREAVRINGWAMQVIADKNDSTGTWKVSVIDIVRGDRRLPDWVPISPCFSGAEAIRIAHDWIQHTFN